jgi:fatty-acyl-CoA synthase
VVRGAGIGEHRASVVDPNVQGGLVDPRRFDGVAELLRASAERHPAREALVFGERRWTYGALDVAVSRVATRLLALGLEPGDRVAAVGRNSDAYLLLFLGCARAGLVHVPANYRLNREELTHLLGHSGARAAFADADLAGVVADAARDTPAERLGLLGDDVLAWAREPVAPATLPPVDGERLAQLLYTSGTTAAPKGAMMSHRALVHEYASCVEALDLEAGDVPLHALPLYHSAQLHVFLMPYLAVGATNHLIDEADAATMLARIAEERVTSLFAPPTVWIALAEHAAFRAGPPRSLAKAYYGAAAMPQAVLDELTAALPAVGFYNIFGQSEAGPLTTVLGPADHARKPLSVGTPVAHVEVRVVDERMRDVAPGEHGEVVYRSPQLCDGYWDAPEATAAAFDGGWFHSGDLVRHDADGYLYVVDRLKDVINTGGVLVASREVEEALYRHPAVSEAAVIGTPHERWVEAITAVVVLREPVEDGELLEHARAHLASFKVPKAFHVVDELPKNPSGKALKRELRERFGGVASALGLSADG